MQRLSAEMVPQLQEDVRHRLLISAVVLSLAFATGRFTKVAIAKLDTMSFMTSRTTQKNKNGSSTLFSFLG